MGEPVGHPGGADHAGPLAELPWVIASASASVSATKYPGPIGRLNRPSPYRPATRPHAHLGYRIAAQDAAS
jgi:hypothetical protein